ncbi:hypothetical protein D018_2944A, partial [Vibrio parahaemolyticus VP2007-007]
MSDTRIARP